MAAGLLAGRVSQDRGVLSWSSAARRGVPAMTAATMLSAHAVELPEQPNVWLMPGFINATQGQSFTEEVWERLALALERSAAVIGRDALVDTGRLVGDRGNWPLLHAADQVLVAVRPSVRSVHAAQDAISRLRSELGDLDQGVGVGHRRRPVFTGRGSRRVGIDAAGNTADGSPGRGGPLRWGRRGDGNVATFGAAEVRRGAGPPTSGRSSAPDAGTPTVGGAAMSPDYTRPPWIADRSTAPATSDRPSSHRDALAAPAATGSMARPPLPQQWSSAPPAAGEAADVSADELRVLSDEEYQVVDELRDRVSTRLTVEDKNYPPPARRELTKTLIRDEYDQWLLHHNSHGRIAAGGGHRGQDLRRGVSRARRAGPARAVTGRVPMSRTSTSRVRTRRCCG